MCKRSRDDAAADDMLAELEALVLYVAPPVDDDNSAEPPIDAVPLSARPAAACTGALVPYVARPMAAVPAAMAAAAARRSEPEWLRSKLLPKLRLRLDLPVHFIDAKAVTRTDVDPHQNRFRLPSDGVNRRLRPLLTPDEVAAANLDDDSLAPRPKKPRTQPNTDAAAAVVDAAAADQPPQPETGKKSKKEKKKGKKHGGLPVVVVDYLTGAFVQLQLSRWDSSRGTVIKGDGYLAFIRRCRLAEEECVDIWAFKQRAFRNFGVTMCEESPLYIVIARTGDQSSPAPVAAADAPPQTQ